MSLNKDYEKMKFSDGRTKQEMKDDVDINRILERWRKSGQSPAFLNSPGQRQSVDISSAGDFHNAQGIIARAKETFDKLPAKARQRFNNKPDEFLEFMSDKDNLKEAVKLGLVKISKKEPEKVQKVQVINPTPEAPPDKLKA